MDNQNPLSNQQPQHNTQMSPQQPVVSSVGTPVNNPVPRLVNEPQTNSIPEQSVGTQPHIFPQNPVVPVAIRLATSTSKTLPLFIISSIGVVIIVGAGLFLLFYRGSTTPTKSSTASGNATVQSAISSSSGESVSDAFVTDITTNQATAAYKLTSPDTSIQEQYPQSTFAENVQNLTNLVSGKPTRTSYQPSTTPNDSDAPGAPAMVNIASSSYTIAQKGSSNVITINLSLLENGSTWEVGTINVSAPNLNNLNSAFTN